MKSCLPLHAEGYYEACIQERVGNNSPCVTWAGQHAFTCLPPPARVPGPLHPRALNHL